MKVLSPAGAPSTLHVGPVADLATSSSCPGRAPEGLADQAASPASDTSNSAEGVPDQTVPDAVCLDAAAGAGRETDCARTSRRATSGKSPPGGPELPTNNTNWFLVENFVQRLASEGQLADDPVDALICAPARLKRPHASSGRGFDRRTVCRTGPPSCTPPTPTNCAGWPHRTCKRLRQPDTLARKPRRCGPCLVVTPRCRRWHGLPLAGRPAMVPSRRVAVAARRLPSQQRA